MTDIIREPIDYDKYRISLNNYNLNENDFNEYNKIDKESINNIRNSLNNNINYKTLRKIKKGGVVYNKIESELRHKEFLINKVEKEQIKDIKKYLDERNNIIEKNEKIFNEIYLLNTKIDNLDNWNDFIIYDNKKYGITNKTKNNIHIENNCRGNMILESKREECKEGNCRPFMTIPDTYIHYYKYKCDKCNYQHEKIEYK
jgi:hypothetical protein